MAEVVNDFWRSFGDIGNYEEVLCSDDGQGSLAARVLINYGIPIASDSSAVGGELPNLDIKNMDATQVIRMSLMEYSAKSNGLWELMINSDGEAEFKQIGTYDSGVSGHIYHEIQTMDYIEECKGVMVTGGKPLAYRRPLSWTPIWGEDQTPVVYKMDLFTSNCMSKTFSQYATLVFKDIHFASGYNDGVDNLYEINKGNPDDEITGWVYSKTAPGVTKNTEIKYTNTADIPIVIGEEGSTPNGPNIGTLVKPPTYGVGEQPACWAAQGKAFNFTNGVKVDIPSDFRYKSVRGTMVDNFVGITNVYVEGILIADLYGRPKTPPDSIVTVPTSSNADIWATINDTTETVFRLEEGRQYIVSYDVDAEDKVPYVVFSDLSRKGDPAKYGNETIMNINRSCSFFQTNGGKTTEIGTVLPIAETKGIWVKRIHVIAQLNTPSISIFDPDGENLRAEEIAKNLDYLVAPIVTVNAPAPIAYNGRLIDLISSKADHDPTTRQDLTNTDFELALDEMNGGGMSLNFSFLNSDDCIKLSGNLFEYMNSQGGVETVYVCDPSCDPKLGGICPNGGIANSIQYSYTDGGSYTISVSSSGKMVGGFAEVSGGATPKATESLNAEGTIIQDMGNHIYYKVRIDGFGERMALNCCHNILRVGDRVSCSVHNVPIES
jgi:hypothetical protein